MDKMKSTLHCTSLAIVYFILFTQLQCTQSLYIKRICSAISLRGFSSTNMMVRPLYIPTNNNISRGPRISTTLQVNNEAVQVTNSATNKQTPSLLDSATSLFPLWVLLFSVGGWRYPHNPAFVSFAPYVTPALAFTMFTMGITLTVEDFKNVFRNWRYVLVGFIAQYTIMPTLAKLVSKAYRLSPELSVGLILVGCAPGGTASNLVTLIAQADVALSVLMTTASTIAAVVMTPLLVSQLAGKIVNISMYSLIQSVLSVVLAPVIAGLIFNTRFPDLSQRVSRYTPFLSVLLVSMICGTVSAASNGISVLSKAMATQLLMAVVTLHSLGFLLGYVFAKIAGANDSAARTISIETGMQNSALATVLAKHFPSPQLTSIPGVFSATCHSIIGSLLAALWRGSSKSLIIPKLNITNNKNKSFDYSI